MKDHYSRSVTNAGAFDYLSTHFVVTDDRMVRDNPPPDFISQADFALPVGLERKLRQMTKQIEADSQARDWVKIAFTEWLFWASKGDVPRYDNMGGAICTAGFLNMLLRVADIVPISDRKKRGRVFAAPSYWAFRMYSNADTSQWKRERKRPNTMLRKARRGCQPFPMFRILMWWRRSTTRATS